MKSLNKRRKAAIAEAMHAKSVDDFEAILKLCGYEVVSRRVMKALGEALLRRAK